MESLIWLCQRIHSCLLRSCGPASDGLWVSCQFCTIAWLFRETVFFNIGATHGASLARRELEGRSTGAQPISTILFIGDGSLYVSFLLTSIAHVNMIVLSQMTVQELSSMIRSDIKPIIFVFTNGGYTIERLQHSPDGSV
jgi:pyruvate decarboxylase